MLSVRNQTLFRLLRNVFLFLSYPYSQSADEKLRHLLESPSTDVNVLPDSVLLQLLTLAEASVKETAKNLSSVNDLQSCIQVTVKTDGAGQMHALARDAVALQARIENVDPKLTELAADYNQLVLALSQKFAVYDSLLAQLEYSNE